MERKTNKLHFPEVRELKGIQYSVAASSKSAALNMHSYNEQSVSDDLHFSIVYSGWPYYFSASKVVVWFVTSLRQCVFFSYTLLFVCFCFVLFFVFV